MSIAVVAKIDKFNVWKIKNLNLALVRKSTHQGFAGKAVKESRKWRSLNINLNVGNHFLVVNTAIVQNIKFSKFVFQLHSRNCRTSI